LGGVPVVAMTFPPHPGMTRSVSKMNSVNNIRNPDFKGLLLLLKNVLACELPCANSTGRLYPL